MTERERRQKILQESLLVLMDEIHRLCTENGIAYYLIAGSALGAKRHGGFIPWDFDLDIAMPREDYDQFRQVAQEKAGADFAYTDYQLDPHHYGPHALMYYKKAKLTYRDDECNGEPLRPYVYIDIFPLDKAPQDEALQQKQASEIRKWNQLTYYKYSRIYAQNSGVVRLMKHVLRVLMAPVSMQKLNARRDAVMRRYNQTDSPLLCSMCSHYSYKKQCMNRAVYGEPQLVPFEDRQYYVPENNEEYLTRIYGDYMKLPDEEHIEACYAMTQDVQVEA